MSPDKSHNKNIFLVGFMGAGKSTVGRILAEKIGYRYVDADNLIENRIGKTITEIFAERGEEYFRELESETLDTISKNRRQVIATGGGVVIEDSNWDAMKSGGVIIYLKAPIATIWERIKDNTSRPLLQVDDPLEAATGLHEKRLPFYEKADIIIDTENLSPDGVASEIIKLLEVGTTDQHNSV